MAIKGKGRSKRRGVAAAPKPVYVTPKRRLIARRGFQIGFLVVLAIGAIAGVVTGLLIEHHNHQQTVARGIESSIVTRFGIQVDDNLTGIGQPVQTQFQAFSTLNSDITQLKAGQLTSAKAVKEGRKWAHLAATTEAGIRAIPTAQMIQGHADLIDLSDSQNLIADALGVYGQVANTVKLTGHATGGLRTSLIDQAQSLITTASQIFGDGYQKLINERARFGLLHPVNAGQQQGLPPTTPAAVPTAPATSSPYGSKSGTGKHHKKK